MQNLIQKAIQSSREIGSDHKQLRFPEQEISLCFFGDFLQDLRQMIVITRDVSESLKNTTTQFSKLQPGRGKSEDSGTQNGRLCY